MGRGAELKLILEYFASIEKIKHLYRETYVQLQYQIRTALSVS